MQILGLQARISKVFSRLLEQFLTIVQNNFCLLSRPAWLFKSGFKVWKISTVLFLLRIFSNIITEAICLFWELFEFFGRILNTNFYRVSKPSYGVAKYLKYCNPDLQASHMLIMTPYSKMCDEITYNSGWYYAVTVAYSVHTSFWLIF